MKYPKKIVLLIIGTILLLSLPSEARKIKTPLQQHNYKFLTEQEARNISPPELSRATFIQDETGKVFIVYEDGMSFFTTKNLSPKSMPQTIRKEYLAYLLSKDLSNAAEVRIIGESEVTNTPLGEWMQEQCLTEIGITRFSQDYQPEDLPYQEHTLERMIVFWVWLRDYDHGLLDWNMFTLNQDTEQLHVSYDHDTMITTETVDDEDFSGIVWLDIVDLIKIHTPNPDVLTDLTYYVQSHYSNEKLREIIEEIEFKEESQIDPNILLNSLISRRNTLVSDIEAIMEKAYRNVEQTSTTGVLN
ncbi:MAG: hypothetical protein P9M06_06100 [Candidatus Saelkia tenebricola]|nr:hypothetical protein [Candidatus Saelkia tenebricola]